MRVLHISTDATRGGAATAARRLHDGLRQIGIDSHFLARRGEVHDSLTSIVKLDEGNDADERSLFALQRAVINNRSELSTTHFSLPEPSWDLSRHPEVMAADILNLHWVSDLLSPAAIGRLAETWRPVVWTLHDQRGFTGGCHYSAGCRAFIGDCGDCPQLAERRSELPRAALADARAVLGQRPFTIVCPSRWLADCARSSSILGQARIELIPYGLDTSVFRPMDRSEARAAFGFPQSAFVALFGADHPHEKRKGLDRYLAAIDILDHTEEPHEAMAAGTLLFAFFGEPISSIVEHAGTRRHLGRIVGDDNLRALYSAVDVVVIPSQEENLPCTALEAMSCGTPLVASRVGGIPDAVVDGEHGLLVDGDSAREIASAIWRLVTDPSLRDRFGAACRMRAVEDYSLDRQARRYAAVYSSLVAAPAPERRAGSVTVSCPVMEWGDRLRQMANRMQTLGPSPEQAAFVLKTLRASEEQLQEVETDRAARLEVIQRLEAERLAGLGAIERLQITGQKQAHEIDTLETTLARTRAAALAVETHAANLERELTSMHSSWSWRTTGPARRLMRLLWRRGIRRSRGQM